LFRTWQSKEAEAAAVGVKGLQAGGLLHHGESSWVPPQLVFWRVPMRQSSWFPATTPEDVRERLQLKGENSK